MERTEYTSPASPTTPRRRRLALVLTGVLTIAAVTGGGVLAAIALFTSQATVTGQQVGTATVELSADTAASSVPLSVADMLPGDSDATVIDLNNSGTADLYYTVRLPTTTGDLALENVLQVTVTIGAVTETRTLTAWQAGALQLGAALTAGSTQAVTVTVSLPTSAGNALQGTETGFTVQFDAIQARNTTPPTAGWVND